MGPPAIAGTSSEGMQSEEHGEEMMEADDEVRTWISLSFSKIFE